MLIFSKMRRQNGWGNQKKAKENLNFILSAWNMEFLIFKISREKKQLFLFQAIQMHRTATSRGVLKEYASVSKLNLLWYFSIGLTRCFWCCTFSSLLSWFSTCSLLCSRLRIPECVETRLSSGRNSDTTWSLNITTIQQRYCVSVCTSSRLIN